MPSVLLRFSFLLGVATLQAKDTGLNQLVEASRCMKDGLSDAARTAIHWVLEGEDHYMKAQGFLLLGELEEREGKIQQAIDSFRQGQILFSQIHNPVGEVMAHNSLLSILFNSGQLDGALEESNRSLEKLKALDSSAAKSNMDDFIAYLHYLLIRGSLSPEFELIATTHGKNLFIYSAKVFTLTWMGVIERQRGHPEKALRILKEALKEDETYGEMEERILGEIADTKVAMGLPQDAVGDYERALDLAGRKGDREVAMKCTLGLAEIHTNQLKQEKALPLFRESLEIARQLGNKRYEARILLELANSYFSLGLLKQAESTAREAKEVAHTTDSTMEAAANVLLGLISYTADKGDSARAATGDLLQYPLKTGDDHGQYLALVIRNLLDSEKDDDLQPILEEAINTAKGQGHKDEEALAREVLAVMALEHDQFDRAEEEWEAAFNLQGDQENLGPLMGLAIIDLVKERRQSAISKITKIADAYEVAMENIHVEEILAAFVNHNVQSLYDVLIYMTFFENDPVSAFDFSEKAKARAFLKMIGNANIRGNSNVPKDQLRDELALRGNIAALKNQIDGAESQPLPSSGQDDLRRQLQSERRRYSELLREIKETDPEYTSLISVDTIGLLELDNDTNHILNQHSVLVAYYMPPCDSDLPTLVWAVKNQSIYPEIVQISGKSLCEQVGHLNSMIRSREFDSELSGNLYDKILAPLSPFIEDYDLVIAPHGALHFLPFAALWNRKSEKYLVQEHSITYAPSSSVLKYLANKRSPNRGHALVLAHGDDILKHAGEEAKAIARLFDTRPFLGKNAFESRIRERTEEIDILHIATHASFDERNPLLSRLELEAGGGYDGFLEVHEIFNLDLAGTNLVVLSACDTALGQQTRGDELVGMTRAFLYAGSPAVVTTLWSVDDAAAGALMESFYRHLQTGTSIASALREAQVETLSNPRWATPYYWAPYILSGDSHWSPPEEESMR